MLVRKKALWGIVIIVLLAMSLEFLREFVVYRNDKRRLNAAAQQLKHNMTREEVKRIMRDQTATTELGFHHTATREAWMWKSAEIGILWRGIRLGGKFPPMEVMAWFEEEGLLFVFLENT